MNNHKFNYKWRLSDGYPAPGIEQHNTKVFTTFSCGGGSSMGYKLAGFDVFAANDIDPQMKRVYEANHHTEYYFLSDIRGLINKTDWPPQFADLDVLDGSPPCSTFSMAGSREAAWGKEKVFREGQARQTLDDLFFQFIALADRLKPKFVISENVKGMLGGSAKGYVKQIIKEFEEIGYDTQIFLFNAASMGVPQKRERVFFLSKKREYELPKLRLGFNELPITFGQVENGTMGKRLPGSLLKLWNSRRPTDIAISDASARLMNKPNSYFSSNYLYPGKVCNTITASNSNVLYSQSRFMNDPEVIEVSSFPIDYNFLNLGVNYLCGMSVPPIMMAQVAHQVYLQWISMI